MRRQKLWAHEKEQLVVFRRQRMRLVTKQRILDLRAINKWQHDVGLILLHTFPI